MYKPSQEVDELKLLNGDGSNLYPITPDMNPASIAIEPSLVNWQLFETQLISFSGAPASGAFKLTYGGNESTSSVNYNGTAANVQSALREISGLADVTVAGTIAGGLTVYMAGVDGDAGAISVTSSTIKGAATIEIQTLSFSSVPNSGDVTLNYNSGTALLAYNDNAAALQAALRLISTMDSVTVAGSFAAGFAITFTGISGDAALITLSANSLDDGAAVTPTMTETVKGIAAPSLNGVITESIKGAT